jgi:hypothetical protein
MNADRVLDRLTRWGPRIFLGIAAVLLLVAIGTFVKELRFVLGAERATGTVIDLQEERSTDSDGGFHYVYHPVVRFTTAEGRTVEFRSPAARRRHLTSAIASRSSMTRTTPVMLSFRASSTSGCFPSLAA